MIRTKNLNPNPETTMERTLKLKQLLGERWIMNPFKKDLITI